MDICALFMLVYKIRKSLQGEIYMDQINRMLSKEFGISLHQVDSTIGLIDAGNTIPFIARYRKEVTGGLDDTVLRDLFDRLTYLRNLESRREEIIRLIDEQGKLTDEIVEDIKEANTMTELEDIYRPYKPKRRTRATIAREKGLKPLSDIILNQDIIDNNIEDIALSYINPEKDVNTTEDALQGAMDIIAEVVSDNADFRKMIRKFTFDNGIITSNASKDEKSVYEMYYEYREAVSKIVPHRVLAINRGEREGFLSVKIDVDQQKIIDMLNFKVIINNDSVAAIYIKRAVEDAYKRLISPAIEREIRNSLTEGAEEQAIQVFGENLRNLLLQPPVRGKVVMGVDPGYRTGNKVAVVDATGRVLDTGIVYITLPNHNVEKGKTLIKELMEKHDVDIIAIGNGTASRETEIVIAEIIKEIEKEVLYMVVSEAGASVYSASKLASEEFPEYDVALRSAVSIARRLQDPLAELVKIDPKAIGVGQYQHDVNQTRLADALKGVVEDCVNSVGVDLNTASPSLLQYVSGITRTVAINIVEYRQDKGSFSNRRELLKVKKLGPKTFEQCAGFLRIPDGDNILDNTAVHPESYDVARKLLDVLDHTLEDVKNGNLKDPGQKLRDLDMKELSKRLDIGIPTLKDIISELQKPGRDPREELPPPMLRSDIMSIEDLKPGMLLDGTVRNVVDFGAFVDIGVHQDGLVHISELSDRYVKHPMDVVGVGDIVKVKILDVDVDRKRISLTMKL